MANYIKLSQGHVILLLWNALELYRSELANAFRYNNSTKHIYFVKGFENDPTVNAFPEEVADNFPWALRISSISYMNLKR